MQDKEDKLIYDLIFSNIEVFNIDISEYISDIYDYEDFILKIKCVLKKSRVKIVKSYTKMSSKTVIWELKVKK